MRLIKQFIAVLALGFLAACGSPQSETDDVAALAQALRQLSPEVDPAEARRAAEISYRHTAELAVAYEITDPPIVHNTKVNMGIKPRGLCRHWAEDMEKRLKAENFQTLDIHRAIANADNPFRLEHSTALISAKGDDMYDAIVIDPWRKGGVLTWIATREDTRYNWRPREVVLNEKRARLRRQMGLDPIQNPS